MDTLSLADHLHRAALESPEATAVLSGDRAWTFRTWLDDASALAASHEQTGRPHRQSGTSLELALAAAACNLQNRAFFPVDRSKSENPLQTGISLPESLPDVALIIATSGSEGPPRAVLLGNAQLDAAASAANALMALRPGDLWLNCLPLYHIGGQSILWRSARAGAGVLLHEGFDAERIAGDLASRAVTHISLVPAMLARLLDAGAVPSPALRVAMIGGAALSSSLYERAMTAGWPLYVSYGMSETSAQIAAHTPADGPWHEGRVGHLMPGHQIRLDDDGRIRLRGWQVMRGYLDGGGIDSEGWLRTGDLGKIDRDGCLSILGRADDLLISGGVNIHPQQVESCLAACPGVTDVAVTGRPDPIWGDLVVALVVGEVAPTDLLAHARQHLPSAALPRRIRQVARLPRNATGKLQRHELRQWASEADA